MQTNKHYKQSRLAMTENVPTIISKVFDVAQVPAHKAKRRLGVAASVLLVVGVVLFGVSVPQHDFYVDEAFIGEHAYFFARDGYVHSEFWTGFLRQDEYVTLYHRLAVWSGALSLKVFGVHLWALRLVSVVSAVVTALVLVWYTIWRGRSEMLATVLASWLLMPTVFYHAKCFRPEVQTAMFGVLSFVALSILFANSSTNATRASSIYAAFAGASAGAAMLTHLAGVMYVGAGLLLLVWLKCWRSAWWFTVSAALIFSPCVVDVVAHWELFRQQSTDPQAASKLHWTLFAPFANLLGEHERFFRKPQFIVMSSAWLVALVLTWRKRALPVLLLRRYTLLLVLVLGVFLQDKRDYMALYAPFMALMIAEAVWFVAAWGNHGNSDNDKDAASVTPKRRRWQAVSAYSVFAAFVVYGLWFQVHDAFWHKEDVVRLNAAIQQHIPEGAWCLVPMNMMFEAIGRYHLVAFSAAADVWHGDRAYTSVQAAARFCDRFGVRYVVMNCFGEEREVLMDAEQQPLKRPEQAEPAFQTLVKTDEYWILQRRRE